MVTGGLFGYDADTQTFSLPAEHALLLGADHCITLACFAAVAFDT